LSNGSAAAPCAPALMARCVTAMSGRVTTR
jgi:hypothetical protein